MDNDIIWAAGFVDGEGCITINRSKYYRDKAKWYYQPAIQVAQTIKGEVAILKLQKIFGGYVYHYKEKRNRLDTVSWGTRSRDSQKVALALLPYLILKRPQAELLLDFYKCMEMKEKAYRLRDKDYDDRAKLWEKMKNLNARGEEYLKRLNEMAPKGDAIV